MISLGVNAKQPQAFVGVLFDASFGHENTYRRWPVKVPAVTAVRHGPNRPSSWRLE
jgi:hypothetical protein